MKDPRKYESLLALVTENRTVVESAFRRLAEKVDGIERRLGVIGDPCDSQIRRIGETVRRIDERFSAGANPEGIAVDMNRLIAKVENLEKRASVVERIVAQGAQIEFPWFHIKGDRNGHKGRQVQKVWQHLKDHPMCRRSAAVAATFTPDPLGYTNMNSLLSECQRLMVEKYRWC